MPNKKKLTAHGGAGRGQGRKRLGPEPRRVVTARLPESLIARALWLGENNFSLGICRAIETAPEWARKLQ